MENSSVNETSHNNEIQLIAEDLLDDDSIIEGYIKIMNKHSNLKISTSSDPVEAKESVTEFRDAFLIPMIKRLIRGSDTNNRLGLMLFIRISIGLPDFNLATAPGFKDLWESGETVSKPSKNSLSKACLDQNIYAKVKFIEIEDQEVAKILKRILVDVTSKLKSLDDEAIEDIMSGIGIHQFFNLDEEPLDVLNESVTEYYVLGKILNPIRLLYNLTLAEGYKLKTSLQKAEYLKRQRFENLPSGDLKLSKHTFHVFLDITLALKPPGSNESYNFANFEIKIYNCLSIFSGIGTTNFKCLLLIKINFGKELEDFLSDPENPTNKVPFLFKLVNIKDSGITAQASLLTMIHDEIENFSEPKYREKIYQIQRLKDICLKSNSEFVATLIEWTQRNFFELRFYPLYEIDYCPDISSEKYISLFHNGSGENPQVLLISKRLYKSLFKIKPTRIEDHGLVVLSIYDPTRYQIQNYTEDDTLGLKKAKNLFMDKYKNQMKAIDIIKKFNMKNENKVNVLTHFRDGNMKLKIKNFSYYVGNYIIREHVTDRPCTKEDFNEAIEQLNYLRDAGIQLEKIEVTDIFMSKGKCYLTNFDNATFEKTKEVNPLCLSKLEKLRDNAEKSKKPKHQ
ncbi:hypothetical protein BN7_3069 [Wickerhamomyces ciferrii]|uniref:Uncharacterized protein n=1 Tax=Wickerhamomyces ciferrii (strain ATCC 14091 / BCRC 22168 / CBS 111 / JCM 3599 / NBRC 0793 / NRRL Y-1031 F-60-10) TaxID=1206466 RepID=K0KQI2_WICCF|nr:uncharacterized protein BN7_3069 [Wickerhamomyces ciferrii]CCH43518.1 hypothetical protein BN7_3069 [Wickerhamomyces ciferrii]